MSETGRRKVWRWIPWKTALVVVGLTVLLRTWVVDSVVVQTGSMEPYLHGDPDSGDRVLIHKLAYAGGRLPRRFEPVVFTHAEDGGESSYLVKRAVAFPGERFEIRDGELWCSSPGSEVLELVRKDHRDFRSLLVPMFGADMPEAASAFDLDEARCTATPEGLEIRGSEEREDAICCRYRDEVRDGYIDVRGQRVPGRDVVGDLLLRVAFTPLDPGAGFVAELFEGPDRLRFVVQPSALRGSLEVRHQQAQEREWMGTHPGLPMGVECQLEFWNVDGRFGVAFDGQVLLTEIHPPGKEHMGDTSIGPAFGVFGGRGRVRRVEIERDLHYTSAQASEAGALQVPAGQIFVLGDNARQSRDSRHFGPIPLEDLVGRPFAVCWPRDRARRLR